MKEGDTFTMNPRVKATLDAIDKRIKETEERREEERLEEEYLLNGGMRVIGGINSELAESMKEEFEFQTKRAEYLLNGGMKAIRCGDPIDVVNEDIEDIEKEIKKKERAMAEIKQAMSDIEQLMYSATGRYIRKEYERELEEETSVELKTEEIMETEDTKKAIIIEPDTDLYNYLVDEIADVKGYVESEKLRLLEALNELELVDGNAELSKRMLWSYKFFLDCLEKTELKLSNV